MSKLRMLVFLPRAVLLTLFQLSPLLLKELLFAWKVSPSRALHACMTWHHAKTSHVSEMAALVHLSMQVQAC